ncbi:MAG: ATP-dependent sacrificial sulfur transferase LarE [Candidatus Eisenbacteria bacterium]|nr:ATP-dependent sacrificial sulfur transferase LarE [Candidatus Eisenbacteria bacterium]
MSARVRELEGWFREAESVLVAFSGGTDSALLARVAHDVLGERAAAVTGVSHSRSAADREWAEKVAREIGIRHRFVETGEWEDPRFLANDGERCYLCKRELFRLCAEKAREGGFRLVAEGSQVGDRDDHRPGFRAAVEAGVRSPFLEIGMDKREIRSLSRELGLPTWNRPTGACLATRIPPGTAITGERIARAEKAEAFLRGEGFGTVRVRLDGPNARIETGAVEIDRFADADLRLRIAARFREIGFERTSLDIEGYREKDGGV